MEDPPKNAIPILDIPASALCGIDLLSFTTSARFQGIRNVPAGWHFLFTSSTASLSVRHGMWVRIEPADDPVILIKKWHPEREELADMTDGSERARWIAQLDRIWHDRLTPYRQTAAGADRGGNLAEDKQDWDALTDCLTPALLSRVTGGGDWSLTSVSSASQDLEHIPGLLPQSEDMAGSYGQTELRFLPIELKRTWRAGAVGRERTDAAQDRSWALGEIVEKHCHGETELLGEMQLNFVAVLTLGNYSCMEQWKRILRLVLTCRVAVRERVEFFTRFLRLLRLQLRRCDDVEGGLFDLSDQGGALLKMLLKRFRRGLEDTLGDRDSAVREEYEVLEAFVRAELGWQLDDSYVRSGKLQLEDGEEVDMDINDLEAEDETGEYAPVVVELEDRTAVEHG